MPRKVCFQASTWSCAYLRLLRKLRKLDVLNSYILDKNLYKVLYMFPSLSLNSLIQNNTLLIQNKNYLQRISPIARHCIKANRYRLQLRSRHRKGGRWSQSPERCKNMPTVGTAHGPESLQAKRDTGPEEHSVNTEVGKGS